jgi:hypothetical protein
MPVRLASDEKILKCILPAGCYTHALSERLNGALRSPLLPAGQRRISFHVVGEHSAAVRLISNSCQLNYANYKALTSDALGWVTFEIPADVESLRTYAELVTKLDNPKYPDQLGTLGGDKENHRIPWEQAFADPRSYFGITQCVLHDLDAHPEPELDHFCALLAGNDDPKTLAECAERYAGVIGKAAEAWHEGRASDADVRWLDWLARNELLDHSLGLTPKLASLVAEYRDLEAHLALPRVVPGLGDFGEGFDQPVLEGGEFSRPGKTVPRRYLEVLDRCKGAVASTIHGSGRWELAEAIASADNPLTSRVMANRVWHHLFGTGLVETVDDFGRMGEQPSHPLLLDHLATRFVEQGWSIKSLIRYIVMSKTFQASSLDQEMAAGVDPNNRLLHHYPARRMEAEVIRDSILATSGGLDTKLFGDSVPPYREQPNSDRRLFPGPLDGRGRRSVYIKVNLMEGNKFLGAFDLPGGKVARGRRDVTNVPEQALSLLNDPFVMQQTGVWADRLTAGTDESVESRVEAMFLRALGRPPTRVETEEFQQLVFELASSHNVSNADLLSARVVWKDVAAVIFNLVEFTYIP